ncbi:DUF5063 domain-containing protein [Roseateles amylovorans]|uniref:DUF5063 domain-containing protein n=1 Tax=Roseateles amylovorans TaxID=2978473 RepID=A0ABY6B4N8_9BURK|nr:DUF5063 domain-containing protein [Roseateles amylovorans]UXH79252.1 DUF5063 domain-containing protein [Roseateles amylovorans]
MQALQPTQLGEFVELACGYCQWCEGQSLGIDPEAQAARWLALLYASALSLPRVGGEYGSDLPELPPETLARAESNLARFFGWYYRAWSDPDPAAQEAPGMGDLGDDLLDVYTDLKRGLVLFEAGMVDDALWHWSFLHRIHWGRHAVHALGALHGMHVSKGESV